MNKVLKDLPFTIAYLDYILIYSKMVEEHLDHLEHLQQVFIKLWNVKLSMKLSKCHFFAKEIQYLGHIFSATGIKTYHQKWKLIKSYDLWKTPNKYELSFVL